MGNPGIYEEWYRCVRCTADARGPICEACGGRASPTGRRISSGRCALPPSGLSELSVRHLAELRRWWDSGEAVERIAEAIERTPDQVKLLVLLCGWPRREEDEGE